MPDVEKIIKALEHHNNTWECNGCPYEDDPAIGNGKCPVYDDALALLREQEPVKPKRHSSSDVIWWYVCGKCDHAISPGDSYCGHCGRAVKWE